MFHCVEGSNAKEKVAILRRAIAQHVQDAWDEPFNELLTTAELLSSLGWTKEEYQRQVVMESHWGDEWELIFLAQLTKQRLWVFRDEKDHWQQFAEYGREGPVCRMLFTPSRTVPHYDLIIVREMWERECQEREAESEAATVKEKAMAQTKKKQAEEEDRRRMQARQAVRKQKVWSIRTMGLDADMDDAEVVDLLLELSNEDTTEEQRAALVHVLGHDKPWDILNVQRTASEKEASAAFKAVSMLVHPDKCKHPRGVEAF